MTSNPSPRSGEDSYDIVDDALTALAERRGLWLGNNITAVALVTTLIQQAQQFLPTWCTTPSQRLQLATDRLRAGSQPRRRPAAIRPRLTLAEGRWPYQP